MRLAHVDDDLVETLVEVEGRVELPDRRVEELAPDEVAA